MLEKVKNLEKTLRRWQANIKWLLNHPPTNVTTINDVPPCEICGKINTSRYYWVDGISICHPCIGEAFRKIFEKN